MRILIHSINYSPELTGIGKYTGEMSEWLAAGGHDVRVVTAPPYYPEWQVHEGYSSICYHRECLAAVDVWRCPLYVPEKPSGLKRIFHLASFALSSFFVMLRQVLWKPDVVLTIEPPLFCAPAAWLTARLSGAKCRLHIQDFEVNAAFDLGIIRFSWMKQVISAFERWLMRRFDSVSTISTAMLNSLKEKGVDVPVLFPNWADLSTIQYDSVGREQFRSAWGIKPEQTLCLYAGNIAVKQGLEILLEAAGRLPDIYFVICGDGANRQALQAKAESLALTNLAFLPLQPPDKLAALLSAADIHLVIQKPGAADLVMPSKLTNILAVGGYAIVTAKEDTELGRLAEAHPGIFEICLPDNVGELTRLIESTAGNLRGSQRRNSKARQYAENCLEKEKILTDFVAELGV